MTSQLGPIKPSVESYQADPANPFKLDLLRALDRRNGRASAPSITIGAAPLPGSVAPGSAVPKQAPGPVAVHAVATGPATTLPLEAQATSEWKASADLQSTFPTVGAYIAFRQAVAAGRVRGYDATWRPSDGLVRQARSQTNR